MEIPTYTTYDARIGDDMNNLCPIESQSIDNIDGHLTYDTGNGYIWPSLPTDAYKFIVPPAIY
jgi:hypothetical protein